MPAADGVQAVSETLELGPQVVLMDAHLPGGQSMEALKQIKQLNLDTRVLMLSAQDREEYLYETLRAGADGFVLKDIAPDELAEAVRIAPHSPYFGPGALATVHLIAAKVPEARFEQFYLWPEATLYPGRFGKSVIEVPQTPGLGVDPDPDVMRRYRT